MVRGLDVFRSFFAAYSGRMCSSGGLQQVWQWTKPSDDKFPAMLELFSRAPDGLKLPDGCHLSPIRIDKDISSLSAILLDDAYYHFVMSQRKETGGLSWVGAECLIPLKANAWLELSARKESGDPVDSKVVNKHRKDVIQLSQLLVPSQPVKVASKIFEHLSSFLKPPR